FNINMLFIPKSDPISRENFEFEGFYGIDTGDNRTFACSEEQSI
ncbi:19238_t:CDS:1, partial [Rhizophagus irregularis]